MQTLQPVSHFLTIALILDREGSPASQCKAFGKITMCVVMMSVLLCERTSASHRSDAKLKGTMVTTHVSNSFGSQPSSSVELCFPSL